MKNIFALLIVLSIFNCENSKTETIDYAILRGNITNPTGDKFLLIKGQDVVEELAVSKDGKFMDTLTLDRGLYTFRHGNEASQIYIAPEYHLNLTLDTQQFDETINYTGKGSKNNTYLAE